MMNIASAYLPILIFMAVGFGLSIVLVSLSFLRAKRRGDAEKLSPYECGFDPFDPPKTNARIPMDAKFYLVAILFIVFDLEVAFLFPWAVTLSTLGAFGFFSMMFFLTILTIGFLYEWKKGALDWR